MTYSSSEEDMPNPGGVCAANAFSNLAGAAIPTIIQKKAPPPPEARKPGDWLCDKCGAHNSPSCAAFESHRQAARGAGKLQEDLWQAKVGLTCRMCYSANRVHVPQALGGSLRRETCLGEAHVCRVLPT